jgi:hypothetical protein
MTPDPDHSLPPCRRRRPARRRGWHALRGRPRAALAGFAFGIVALALRSRAFSVSCPAESECVTLDDPDTGDVLDRGCTRPLRADLPEAWIIAGSHVPSRCRGGLGAWFDRLWRDMVPFRTEPPRPLNRSRR